VPFLAGGDSEQPSLHDYRGLRFVRCGSAADFAVVLALGIDVEGRETLVVAYEPHVGGRSLPDEASPTGTVHYVTATLANPRAQLLGTEDRDP
jgi:hypothetical protein